MSETLILNGREVLTRENIARVDAVLDREDVYAKAYTQTVDGELTTVGLRVGVKPHHVVALFGDTLIRRTDGTYAVRRSEEMTADQWNALVPVGARVTAYPGVRPEKNFAPSDCPRLETVTRTPAWALGDGTPVVSVEGYAGGISLEHVDVVQGRAS